ncbi:MAG: sarcosine oxidase subunit gamma SoxG [Desulfobacteraceae bacterium 4572_123]|nr:MAG: sarcosine oxidase subunit gamma SoxG [Desulfobacteraceae bacterium 4572_123]
MAEIQRQSPVRFKATPLKTEVRENWIVALEYDEEGQGPWLVDLAHKSRWDLQDSKIGEQTPCDLTVPAAPGECTFSDNTLINRMNRTQASIYHLGGAAPAMPDFSGYTDVSENTVFLALFGPRAFLIAEKLSNLDFIDPAKKAPFLLQGPFCHVPCQIIVLEKGSDRSGGFLLTCSRGYGDSIIHAVMQAGSEFDLRPAGENRFNTFLDGLDQ